MNEACSRIALRIFLPENLVIEIHNTYNIFKNQNNAKKIPEEQNIKILKIVYCSLLSEPA